MKYTAEIKVNIPIEEFIKKIDTIDNRKHWQRGLVSVEHISGDLGQLGSKLKLIYHFGKQKSELIETITKRNFPSEFHINYTATSVHNEQCNLLKKTSDGFTIWTSHNEFVPLNFRMRLMLFFLPSVFKKQSLKYMQDFKNFAENGTSVANA